MAREGEDLTGNDQFEGYCADLAKKIAEFVQFKYILEPVKDAAYGAQDDNGTWNGMVGVLVRNVSGSLWMEAAAWGIEACS